MTTLQTQYDASDVLHALESVTHLAEIAAKYNDPIQPPDPLLPMNLSILRDLRDAAKREAGR